MRLSADASPSGLPSPGSGPAKTEAAERRWLERELRDAVRRGAFQLHYQPRLALASGDIAGAEALIRWPDRRRGMVSPANFLPLAERADLIGEIGGRVLRAACEEAAGWGGVAGPKLSVPVLATDFPAGQIADAALLEQVAAALEASGLPPERLELELTEAMLLEAGLDALLGLSALRDLGVGLALDDFGAAHASLAMLRRLPLNVLKLDRSLLHGVARDRQGAEILRAVVQAGHALGMCVVADGVEARTQRDILLEVGCDEGQGSLFAPAMAPAQLRRHPPFGLDPPA